MESTVLWFTGLSGAGKTTLAEAVAARLRKDDRPVEILDGDVVRKHLCAELGFSKEDRETNIRRIAFVAQLLVRNGVTVAVAAISPFRANRDEVRALIGRFVEIHVAPPLDVCIKRDTKGLYAKALSGELPQFTGINDPYEEPLSPELVLDTSFLPLNDCVLRILDKMRDLGYLEGT